MTKETSSRIVKLASRGALDGTDLTPKQVQQVCASALAQYEREGEAVKAWGIWDTSDNTFCYEVYRTKAEIGRFLLGWVKAFPVEIRRIAKPRQQKGKGK